MKNKYQKLFVSIVMDGIGFIPIPFFDFVWAPLSGYVMTRMYKGKKGKVAGFISFLEEILPVFDVIPTFTLMWIYVYILTPQDTEKKDENVEVLP